MRLNTYTQLLLIFVSRQKENTPRDGMLCKIKYINIVTVLNIRYGISSVFTFFLIFSFHKKSFWYSNIDENIKKIGTAVAPITFETENCTILNNRGKLSSTVLPEKFALTLYEWT